LLRSWPTPKASDPDGGKTTKTEGGGNSHLPIAAREAWPTPMAGTPAQNGNNEAGGTDFSRKIDVIAGVRETVNGPRAAEKRKAGGHSVNLQDQAMSAWSTPRASDGEKGGPNMKFGAGGTPLPAQAAQTSGPTPNGSPEQTGKRGVLAPAFVSWLMGFPREWRLCLPSYDDWRKWQVWTASLSVEQKATVSAVSEDLETRSSRRSRRPL